MSYFSENLRWLQSNIDKSVKGIESLMNGVVYCKALNSLDGSLLKLELMRIPVRNYND
jgi:hypothetical protein